MAEKYQKSSLKVLRNGIAKECECRCFKAKSDFPQTRRGGLSKVIIRNHDPPQSLALVSIPEWVYV
jgi:hypothetical protein